MKITAQNIVKAINALPKTEWFEYINPKTRTQVQVARVDLPEGPIGVLRRNPKTGEVKELSISTEMIWRVANAISPKTPINIDRVLGASYNSRSALETLLALTSEFYWCLPGRIEIIGGREKIQRGHKHLIWLPDVPHQIGTITQHPISNELAISEIPAQAIVYDSLIIEPDRQAIDLDIQRRHILIQVLLAEIGHFLGFRTWIARNDRGHIYQGRPIAEIAGVVSELKDEKVLQAYGDAINAALLIDCIWFKNGRLMPAVIEVEHSTGVTSGLTRMKRFQDLAPALEGIRWVIAAPDEDREDVFKKSSTIQFQSLNTMFFPYSAIEELYSLCSRRRLTGTVINEGFLDCYMEQASSMSGG